MAEEVKSPTIILINKDGDALSLGKIYIGKAGLDPETNPLSVYFDQALTIEAPQPVRTSLGRPVYNGDFKSLYVGEAYSITIRDENDVLIETKMSVVNPLASLITAAQTSIDEVSAGLETAQSDIEDFAGIAVAGFRPIDAADLATTGNISLTGEQVIDDETTSASRVVVHMQTDATENGVYISGTPWVRADDMNDAAEFQGKSIYVNGGTDNAGRTFACVTDAPEIGVDPIRFALTGNTEATAVRLDTIDAEINADLDVIKQTVFKDGLLPSTQVVGFGSALSDIQNFVADPGNTTTKQLVNITAAAANSVLEFFAVYCETAGNVEVRICSYASPTVTVERKATFPVVAGYNLITPNMIVNAGEYCGALSDGIISRNPGNNSLYWSGGAAGQDSWDDTTLGNLDTPAIQFHLKSAQLNHVIADEALRTTIAADRAADLDALPDAGVSQEQLDALASTYVQRQDGVIPPEFLDKPYTPLANKGAAGGYVPLNGQGEIDPQYLNITDGVPLGPWNPNNTPVMDSTTPGEYRDVTVAGTSTSPIAETWAVGDKIKVAKDGTIYRAPAPVLNITYLKQIIDVVADPVTIGAGEDYASVDAMSTAMEQKTFKGDAHQPITYVGTNVGGNFQYEQTLADTTCISPYLSAHIRFFSQNRFNTGGSGYTMEDAPRWFRTVDGSGDIDGWVASGTDTETAQAARSAWLTAQWDNNAGTRIHCVSKNGLFQQLHGHIWCKGLNVRNDSSVLRQALTLGDGSREGYANGSAFWDEMWFDNFSVGCSTGVGGFMRWGSDNRFQNGGIYVHGQYSGHGYSDPPSDATTYNQVVGCDHAYTGKGALGTYYYPRTQAYSNDDRAISIFNGDYISISGGDYRDNLKGVWLKNFKDVRAQDARFGDTRDAASLHCIDVTRFDGIGAQAHGSELAYDILLEGIGSMKGFITPTADGSAGTGIPALTRITRDASYTYSGAGVVTV